VVRSNRPGATINFVYSGGDTNYSAFDALIYAVDNQIGTIISSSYGTCEANLDGYSLSRVSSRELRRADDHGGGGRHWLDRLQCLPRSRNRHHAHLRGHGLAVDYPASSQYVTGMGGTEIDQSNANYSTVGDGYWQSDPGTTDIVNSVLQYIPEAVWNDDDSQYGLSASGGGASALFTKPTWQTGVTASLQTANAMFRTSRSMVLRTSPDTFFAAAIQVNGRRAGEQLHHWL